MKIPEKIKVAGHNYKVEWDNKGLSREGLFGQANFTSTKIRLCKIYNEEKRAKTEIERTLIHEIVHVVDRHYNNCSLSEKTVARLSEGLYQVLKDNFKF